VSGVWEGLLAYQVMCLHSDSGYVIFYFINLSAINLGAALTAQ